MQRHISGYVSRFLVLTVMLACCGWLGAQELAATMNGTVTDPSGAVISGATVTIAQNGVTGATRTIQTNAQGSYTVTNLAPGDYTVTVTATGFQTFSAQNVTLFVAQTRAVNAKMKVGSVGQTVSVMASGVALQTTTSNVAATISGTQTRELVLNNRNFESLITLLPGVVNNLPDEVGFGLNNTSSVSVNGARDTANNWMVDGSDINDSGSNATLLNVPSVDAIQETTLETSTYDASYGRSAGGQILVATKSGTSDFHGNAYEFVRNNILNANNYFNKFTTPITPRAIQRYNDFGFTIGGPLYIPKVFNTNKDKYFFFWSEEWRKVSSPSTVTIPAPTQAMLHGISPGLVTGPTGCVAYNASTDTSTINPNCYSKNAKVYLTNVFDPFPANSGTNYITSFSAKNNVREDMVRLDVNLTKKLHFFGRAMRDEIPENFPLGLFAGNNYPGLVASAVNAPGYNVVGNLTWVISPRMVNEAEFAYTQGTLFSAFLPGAIADSPTVAGALTNNTAYKDPYGRLPSVGFQTTNVQGLAQGSTPYNERNLDRTLFDNFSLTAGKHSIRMGGTVSQMLKTENASSGAASFTFNTWGDFLLGNALRYTQNSRDTVPDLHYFNFEAYAQDDWKMTDRLTLNLGLRYSYFPSPNDVLNTLNNFDPTLFDPAKAPAIDPVSGNFVAGQNMIPATYTNGVIFPQGAACSQAKAISPQVTVTCSPYGSKVNPDSNANFAPRIGFAYIPDAAGKMAIHGGYGIFFDRTLNGIWEQNAFADPPLVQTAFINNTKFDQPLAGSSSVSLGPSPLTATGNPTFKNPSYMNYNLSFQDEVVPNTIFGLAYVGGLGRHLLGDRNLNQPTLAARAANPTAFVNAVVPYLGYSVITTRIPAFTSNYNSMQVTLNHRERNGLTLGVAYTWSKTLTNQSNDRGTGSTDTYNPSYDYGPSALNTPNMFIANFVYDLPFYKGQPGLVGRILGGWEASGIVEFESGQSFSVTQPTDPFDCVTPPIAPPGSSACEAGTYPGGIAIDPSTIAPRPDQVGPIHMLKKQTEWFSTNSFANAVGHFGSERNGAMLGPGLERWDLGAMKNIKIAKSFRMQFRGEFFNAFNHANFNAVDSATSSGTFGQLTSTHDPRQIQIGAKFYF